MRAPILLLLLALPLASAAGEVVVAVEYEEEPFLLREQRATIRVDVDCGLFSGVPPEVRVELAVEGAPYWLTALPDPRELAASPTECPGGRRTMESLLKMFMHPVETPPLAGQATTMTIRATSADARGTTFEGSATIDVAPGLFGSMSVVPGAWPASVRPGDSASITHEIINDWNAPAIVEWTPDGGARALKIEPLTIRVPANARANATFTATAPFDAATGPFDMAVEWKARRDGGDGEALGNGTRAMTLFVDGPLPQPPPPATGPTPGKMVKDDAPGPGAALLMGAVAAVALALRPSRR